MENKVTLQGKLTSSKKLQGQASSQVNLSGRVIMGGTKMSDKDVVKYTEQNPSFEESAIARKNIRAVGEFVEGKLSYPFNIKQIITYHEFEKELLDPVVAAPGAEIYNDYENNIAIGSWSIARGCGTQALGDFCDASGWLTKAAGFCSIASGRQTECSGNYSHSEGHNTKAMANDTHAEGEGCQALKARAHAEGYYTTANGNQAHAEGMNTIASGVNSHAEGWGCEATGQNSFAAGKNTKATGTNSTARGLGTIASGAQQFVSGKYNVSDTNSLVIVGKGTSDSARSNAYKLDANGNGFFAGSVECTKVILSSPNGSRFAISVDDNGNILATKI